MSLPTHISRVKEGEFISAEHYNTLVDICEALMRGEGRNGVKFIPAEAGFVWRGTGTGSEATPAAGGTGNFDFRSRYLEDTTYNSGSVVVYDNSELSDIDHARIGTYISLEDNNIGNYPPYGSQITNDHWATLAVGHVDRQVWGNPTGELRDTLTNYTYINYGDLYIRGNTGFGETEGVPNVAQVNLNPLAFVMSGERNTLNFQTDMEYDSYGINLAPMKLQVCINGETKYLHVLGMITDT